MKTKKKVFSIFAILFALLFAIGLVFGVACSKDDDDDTKDNEPEITEPEDDGSGNGSGSGDGSGSGSGNTDTQGEGTGSGSGSGDGSESGSGDGSGSGSGSGTVTIPDDAENVYPLKVDFSDSNTYTWIDNVKSTDGTMTDTGETYQYLSVEAGNYTTGLVTYVAVGNSTIGKDKAGALYTSSDKNSYFAIDLSGLDGDYIEIEASMCGNSDNGTADRILAVATSSVAPTAGASTVLDYVASKTKSEVEDLDYVGIVADDTMYITWDNNIQIFSIEINIYGDKKPDFSGNNEGGEATAVTEVTLSTDKITRVVDGTYNISATVTTEDGSSYAWTGDEEWKSDNTSVATVTSSANGSATITAVSAGTTTVTLTIDENNSAACTVVVSAATTADPTTEGGYTVDFSDSDTYKWIETVQVYDDSNKAYVELESGKTFTDGLLTLVTGSSMKIQSNALSTGGTSSTSQRYIKIDLSQYVGKTVSISAEMLSGSSGKNRSLVLGTEIATALDTTAETYLTSASSSLNSSSDTKSQLSYTGTVSEGEVLYLSWVGDPTATGSSADSGNIKIYNLNITVTQA